MVGLDPVSLYHLAQMPAMVMLCLALHHRAATDPTRDASDRRIASGSAAAPAEHEPAVAG